MRDEDAQHPFKVAAAEDEQPVKAVRAECARTARRRRLLVAPGSVDHLDPSAAGHLVEGGAELAVSVVDQKACPLEQPDEATVARLVSLSSFLGG
jgi:hypothetical protein